MFEVSKLQSNKHTYFTPGNKHHIIQLNSAHKNTHTRQLLKPKTHPELHALKLQSYERSYQHPALNMHTQHCTETKKQVQRSQRSVVNCTVSSYTCTKLTRNEQHGTANPNTHRPAYPIFICEDSTTFGHTHSHIRRYACLRRTVLHRCASCECAHLH